MSPADLALLKSCIDKTVELTFDDGTVEIASIISVFDKESSPDVFYDLVPKASTGCSAQLSTIASVRPVSL